MLPPPRPTPRIAHGREIPLTPPLSRRERGVLVGGYGKQLVERHAHAGRAAQQVEQDERAFFTFVAFEYAFEALEGAFQNSHCSSAPEDGLLELM